MIRAQISRSRSLLILHPLLYISFLFVACNGNERLSQQEVISKNTNQENSTINVNTKTVFLDTSSDFMYFNSTDPVVFADTAYVYAKEDTSSEVIAGLPFNSPLSLNDLDGYWGGWYKVETGKGKGYIRAADVALHTFSSRKKHEDFRYFILTSFSERYNPSRNGFAIYTYHVSAKRFIDTFYVDEVRADIVKEMNHAAWKNTSLLLYTTQINAYCGGGETNLYLIEANDSFSSLLHTCSYMDDGEGGGGMYSTVTFPKNVQTDTILYRKYEEGPVYRKNRPVKNKDGSYIMETMHDTTKYLIWDGTKLSTVRSKTH